MAFVPPQSGLRSFTCPHCGVLARQYQWGYPVTPSAGSYAEQLIAQATIRVSKCENCHDSCLWWKDQLVYPDRGGAPTANPDMPRDVLADYEEAARVYTKSPRGAAALLRLAIQKLMVDLGESGKNINDDIGSLVKKGLPVTIQQALDVVRVTGNNAVHPGQIDANDEQVAAQLFPLINLIVEYMISAPARIAELYQALPEGARAAVERRDTPK